MFAAAGRAPADTPTWAKIEITLRVGVVLLILVYVARFIS